MTRRRLPLTEFAVAEIEADARFVLSHEGLPDALTQAANDALNQVNLVREALANGDFDNAVVNAMRASRQFCRELDRNTVQGLKSVTVVKNATAGQRRGGEHSGWQRSSRVAPYDRKLARATDLERAIRIAQGSEATTLKAVLPWAGRKVGHPARSYQGLHDAYQRGRRALESAKSEVSVEVPWTDSEGVKLAL